jgi:hypothetical protein
VLVRDQHDARVVELVLTRISWPLQAGVLAAERLE